MKVTLNNILKQEVRRQVSSRGGGIEINLENFGFREGSLMSAYQNYLGGGMLGAVQSNHNIFRTSFTQEESAKLEKISDTLKEYFHSLTNPDEDEWESLSYEQNQSLSASAY